MRAAKRGGPALSFVGNPRALLDGLFEHSPVAFQIYRADGHCLRVNPAFVELFGSAPPPEYNVLRDDLLEQQGFLDLVRRAFAGETVQVPPHWYDPRQLRQVRVQEGRRVGVQVTLFPLLDAKGVVQHIALCFKDVTSQLQRQEDVATLEATTGALRLSENEARRANEHLERLVQERTAELSVAYRELESLCYSVAHDLRAPLRGMNGFAEILLEEYSNILDDEGRDCLRRIQGSALLMGRVIDALLSVAKVTRSELKPVVVDLSGLARSVLRQLAAQDSERTVQAEVGEDLVARIDPSLARTLFENLLGNAWKFTRQTAEPRIEIGNTVQGGAPAFFVRDNGAGFNMAYSNKLFVPFQRLHAVREFPGTGIGLATSFRIVDRHGGRIWAEGIVGEGATFFFTLP
jgi:signal transduction histidine kinase